MLAESTLQYLRKLAKNNNKPWFDLNRNIYEHAREDFLGVVEKLISSLASFDASLVELVAKNCCFRINRDVRFSKDKTPYKNHFSAYFNSDGKKGLGAGYYVHVEPGKGFAAAGIWMPEPKILAAIRQEIDYNLPEFQKIISAKDFRKTFANGVQNENKLSRPPKGYEDDNAAIEYLKLKSFVVSAPITDDDLTHKNFVPKVSAMMKNAHPFIQFLNRAID